MRTVLLASTSALLFLAGGCCIQYAEQEVQLRYNAADDSADLLLIYKGVTASEENEKKVEEAAAVVLRLLEGRRELDTPIGHFDLDDPALYAEDADPFTARVAAGVALLDHGVFLDEEERLAGWQHFHIPGASRVLDLLNREIAAAVLEAAAKEDFAESTPLLDDRTRELWRLRAASGEPWVYLADGEIEMDIPMTPEAWDRVQAFAIAETASADAGDGGLLLLSQVFLHLRRLEIAGDRVIVAIGAPVTGIYRFTYGDGNVKYSPKLKEALAACGVRFEAPKLEVEEQTPLTSIRGKLGLETQSAK